MLADFKTTARAIYRKGGYISVSATSRGTITVYARCGQKIKGYTKLDSSAKVTEAIQDAFVWIDEQIRA